MTMLRGTVDDNVFNRTVMADVLHSCVSAVVVELEDGAEVRPPRQRDDAGR